MIAATRRAFITGAASVVAALPSRAVRGQTKPRIVVVGGGIGGTTVAKYVATSIEAIDITLVEPSTRYTTCVFGNLYLAGMRSLESLTHGYETLTSRYGVRLVRDQATIIDPASKRVRLASGETLPFDRVIVSPGISFVPKAIDGFDAEDAAMPHAWLAGPQAKALRAQLEAMADGGVFLIVAPPDRCRSPQSPYERASLAAYYLKQFKPRSKVIILDSKEAFVAQDLFEDGWKRHFPGMIEWLPARATGGIIGVDPRTRSVRTTTATFHGDVTNVIAPQCAGTIARTSGLTDASGWCPVDPLSFASKLHPAIHVIGDAADAGDMTKSAFAANAQAKACAFAIAAELQGRERPAPHLFDASFAFLAGNDAVSDIASFVSSPTSPKRAATARSQLGEPKESRRQTVQQAYGWYDAFMLDVFG